MIGKLRARAAGNGRVLAVRMVARHTRRAGIRLMFCALLSAVLPTTTVIAMGRLVGIVEAARGPAADLTPLIHELVLVAVLLVGSLVMPVFVDWIGAAVRVRLIGEVRMRLMRAVHRPTGVAHLDDAKVLNRLAMAEGVLADFKPADAPLLLAKVYSARLTGLVACAAIALTYWWLGLALALGWLLVRIPLRTAITAHVRALGGEAAVMRRARYFQELATDKGAAAELRLFGLGDWATEEYRSHWLSGMTALWKVRGQLGRAVGWIAAGVVLANVAACGWLAYRADVHAISLTTLATAVPLVLMASAIGGISFDDLSVEWMVAALPKLQQLEEHLSAFTADPPGIEPVGGRPQHAVTFHDVGFSYPGASTPVFDGLDLTIPVGCSTAIVGANGVGKTTLVKLIARLIEPTGGRIETDGVPLTGLAAAEWQRAVAVITQDFVRFPASLADNVTFGRVEARDDLRGRDAALESVGGLGLLDELPAGWDTLLAEGLRDGTTLSAGQWQLVALARALFAARHGARVLLLDEPTSWLDVRGEAAFYRRFLELTAGLTTVVISHRFSTVRQADRICVLDADGVAEQGSHDELMDSDGVYARMFRLQAARFEDAREQEVTS